MTTHPALLPCPFCGQHLNCEEDEDVLYPTGIGWKDEDFGYRSYHSLKYVPETNWCWSVHCPTTAGGCGVEMSGDTKQEAIDKWNTRSNEIDQLRTIIAEAYQVVGVLANDVGRFDDPDVQNVLTNLAEHRLIHKDVLPFK